MRCWRRVGGTRSQGGLPGGVSSACTQGLAPCPHSRTRAHRSSGHPVGLALHAHLTPRSNPVGHMPP